ncbi:MAG: UDP-3-O-acyl-N-acetylglucosamine deacetylase [Leptospirillia bacterium]
MASQHTVAKEAHFKGVGLHSGEPVHLTVAPAAVDTGIRFEVQLPGQDAHTIAVTPENLVATSYATSLGSGSARTQTVEHLLSALSGLGIDNALIRMDAGEVPIMDGSAAPFVDKLVAAGNAPQSAPRRVIRITEPVRVEEDNGDKWLEVRPLDTPGMMVDYCIDFNHPAVGRQNFRFIWSRDGFVRELASARTFGFFEEVAALRNLGLARGGSLENAVVIGENGVMNPEGLRFSNEFVRHKILDLFGDFALLGRPLWGHVVAHRSGHSLHTRLVETLLERPDCWVLEEESVRPVLPDHSPVGV